MPRYSHKSCQNVKSLTEYSCSSKKSSGGAAVRDSATEGKVPGALTQLEVVFAVDPSPEAFKTRPTWVLRGPEETRRGEVGLHGGLAEECGDPNWLSWLL